MLGQRKYDNLPEFSEAVKKCLENQNADIKKLKTDTESHGATLDSLNNSITEIKDDVCEFKKDINDRVIEPFEDLFTVMTDLRSFLKVVKFAGKGIMWIGGIVGGIYSLMHYKLW